MLRQRPEPTYIVTRWLVETETPNQSAGGDLGRCVLPVEIGQPLYSQPSKVRADHATKLGSNPLFGFRAEWSLSRIVPTSLGNVLFCNLRAVNFPQVCDHLAEVNSTVFFNYTAPKQLFMYIVDIIYIFYCMYTVTAFWAFCFRCGFDACCLMYLI